MWKRNTIINRILCSCTLALLLAAPVSAAQVSGTLKGKVLWQGQVELAGPVVVEKGASLHIAAGTVIKPLKPECRLSIYGKLRLTGTAAAPVVVTPLKGWQGIEFLEAGEGHTIDYLRIDQAETAIASIASGFSVRHATFRDCGTAIKLVREANPLIEDSLFERNEIGLDNQMKSRAQVRRSRFVDHRNSAIVASHNSIGVIEGCSFEKNKQAIGLIQKYQDRISGNRFLGNEVAIYCNQTQNTPAIAGNTFERNQIALVNFSFAYPTVEQNSFSNNDTAIRNDQYGSPQVTHNLFRGNKTALYSYRKSNPVVEKNVIEQSDLAFFCDYSSYPVVKNNNLARNKMGVELGIYQSADWEKRSGSKAIMQEQAAARQSQNPLLAKAPSEFRDYVDVSGNWWGEATPQLKAGGNVAIFFDRRDKEWVRYEGFGPDSYRLDEVRYTPWLETPVRDAGVQATP